MGYDARISCGWVHGSKPSQRHAVRYSSTRDTPAAACARRAERRFCGLLNFGSLRAEAKSRQRDAIGKASTSPARRVYTRHSGRTHGRVAHIGRSAMDAVRRCGRLVALMAMGMIAIVPAAHARMARPAAAVHTASTPRHHVRHRHHRRAQPPAFVARQLPSHPAVPAPPARHRPHGRATLPSLAHAPRHQPGSKATAKRAAAPSADGAMLTLASRTLAPRQNVMPDGREHPVTGGRGPPRGSPVTHLRDVRCPAAIPSFVSAALHAPPGASSAPQTTAHHVAAASNCCRASASPTRLRRATHRQVSLPGLPPGRLHAVRLEGATACLTMPSSGGSPCHASHPSPSSVSRSVC